MKLSKRALGLSLGFVWGLAILLVTWWFLIIKGTPGEYLTKLRTIYIGYDVSWAGSIIGFIWGLVHGFIAGVLIAWFYNLFSKSFYKPQS